MSRHARIEEVSDSDSDPDIMDPSAFESSSTALMEPADIPSITRAQPPPQTQRQYDPSKSKRWISLYPIYFDSAKTRAEGRRVGKESAVENPLARTIAAAVAEQGLNVVFEPGKIHPKDWANPGRVKIELKSEDGKLKRPHVKNSMHFGHEIKNYGTNVYRAPPLRFRLKIPKITPNNNRNAIGTSNSRHSPPRQTDGATGGTKRLEIKYNFTIALPCC
jgi:signal recognition particle subunit SRP19